MSSGPMSSEQFSSERRQRSKTVHGASIGILMLETHFPRLPGDLGHASSWPFPVHYKVVRGATAHIALNKDNGELLQPFVEAALELVQMGADGITTSCGFLALLQKQLKVAVGVPMACSSLMQIPWIESLLPVGQRVGILTIDSQSLSPEHLLAAGAAVDTPVAGTENGLEFTQAILSDKAQIDIERCRQDNLDAARQLVLRHPEVGAIVLECTNMVPFAADVNAVTGLPVYSIHTLVSWFQSGLMPRRFPRA